MRASLFMLHSFRSRILALVLGLVTVMLCATLIAVVLRTRAEVKQQAARQLRSAADTAREMLRFRGDQLSSAAAVLTSDFGFKEAVASADTATLLSAVNNDRTRIGADAILVFGIDGRLLASTLDTPSPRTRSDLQSLVASDTDATMLRLYRLIEGRPYQLVLAPVLAPEPIGWTAIAFALNDQLATDMARVLGVEVSFVSVDEAAGDNIGSSLEPARRSRLVNLASAPAMTPFLSQTGNEEFLNWTNPIRSNQGRLALVLQRSMSEALRPYTLVRDSILVIGAAALAIAAALCVLLARSATRPVDALTQAAERLEAGDYSLDVPPASTREFSRLAGAFNAMRSAVADREATIRHQALHDGLTQLPTLARMSEILQQLLQQARAEGQQLVVMLIEIQQFKEIIASLGHPAGDEVLWEVARRLTASAPTSGRVARIATDQFLVVLESVSAAEARAAAESLMERLHSAFDYAGLTLQIETRVGVTAFPQDGTLPSELLQRAELALYRAKENGATVGIFVPGDDALHRHRMAILGQLRRAITDGQLQLFYQPKVTLTDGRVQGCEALVRWLHPERGYIPPGDFIPHAERTGMIRLLTQWVLASALRQLRCWQQAGLEFDVSVNVSPVDLADPGFAQTVGTLLGETAADSRHLILELTESAVMKDLANALRVMEELRLFGVRFSIDDFGTGYSSLAHLKRLPVDEIKIDRAFIQELEARPEDEVIVASTIGLGHALGMKVVAEGVEARASFDTLARLGCDLVQGYLIAKPLPVDEFTRWVTARMSEPTPEQQRTRFLVAL
jgi:diguanylate cyclase